MTLEEKIRDKARALGFDAVGFARADAELDTDFARYEEFLAQGMHGSMAYLAENREVRRSVDQASILEGARTTICVARSYKRASSDEAGDLPFAKLLARYARGQDYHQFLRRKLRKLAAFVRTLAPGTEARPMLDDAPVLERAWAARAGLGFIGKNGMLIAPGIGSFVLLGEVVTTLELLPDSPLEERCGSCTRCLDACPTDAFAKPWVLDARRCISYLTIEHRGAIAPDLAANVGERLFGCDECQVVCPFNAPTDARAHDTRPFAPLPRWTETPLEEVASLQAQDWDTWSTGTPLHRATREGLTRNAELLIARRARER